LVKRVTLDAQERKYNYNECAEKKLLKHRAANFRWMYFSLLASVVLMVFQTGEAYSNLVPTKGKVQPSTRHEGTEVE
jgi:hypothetical protein